MLTDLLIILFCSLGWAAMRERRVPLTPRTTLDALGIEIRDARGAPGASAKRTTKLGGREE